MTLELTSDCTEQTTQIGVVLGRLLMMGDVICLSGDLGAGKTALTAGIAHGWGALEAVNSPTFVLIHEHHRAVDALKLYHLDCYRFNAASDAFSAGIDDLLAGQDVLVIEWPERIESLLPPERLWIQLETSLDSETLRTIACYANGLRYTDLLESLRVNTLDFLQ